MLAFWIRERPYEPPAEHLVAVIGIDKLTFAPLIDPTQDEVYDLVLRVSQGKRAHAVLSHMAGEADFWLEVGREAVGQPVSIAEHRGDVRNLTTPDLVVATAAEQAITWIRERDAEKAR